MRTTAATVLLLAAGPASAADLDWVVGRRLTDLEARVAALEAKLAAPAACPCAATGLAACTCPGTYESPCRCYVGGAAPAAAVVRGGGVGLHSHKCPRCGTVWSHDGGPGSSHNCPRCGAFQNVVHDAPAASAPPAVTYTLPAFGGCASGNCAAPAVYYRRR